MQLRELIKNGLASVLLSFGIVVSMKSANAQLSASMVDPLEKIFPETVLPYDSFHEIDVAKGEVASAQLVLRSGENLDQVELSVDAPGLPNEGISCGAIGFVRAGRQYTDPAVDRLVSNTGFYPDPILDDKPLNLQAGLAQAFYISIPISAETKAGTYPVKVDIRTKDMQIRKEFAIHVHNVRLAKQELWVTNWYSLAHERLALLNKGEQVKSFGLVYWRLIETLANKMAAYGQNTALISPLDLAIYKMEGEHLSIDFSRFDQTVDIFRKAGVLGRIEGGHIGQRAGNWSSPFIVRVPEPLADSTRFRQLPIEDPRAKNFYARFFKALIAHLEEKGWLSDYYQHIADEPTGDNKESYIAIASYVKSIAPQIKIMEACHSKDLAETIDLWVPQLDFLNKDFTFYQDRKKVGDEVWFYTCLSPRGNYANRFIDLPLIKTRLIHWINYKYQIDGYLHWGFNYWNQDPYEETTGINSEGGNILPTGDSWIVYPGYQKLYSSIRLEAMRDGINDYTLLQMLTKKNPDLAKKIIDNMVFRFDWYDTSIKNFRASRKAMLKALSE
ncbi:MULTISPECIES: DUF4091 domain-containing protein [Olivibacter]|uniref:DUF4091 domain-containing protein n=1 Tax=Olivibacter jilunii TaxID=985016 RepID=A0ABW6B1S7_9SPHI